MCQPDGLLLELYGIATLSSFNFQKLFLSALTETTIYLNT